MDNDVSVETVLCLNAVRTPKSVSPPPTPQLTFPKSSTAVNTFPLQSFEGQSTRKSAGAIGSTVVPRERPPSFAWALLLTLTGAATFPSGGGAVGPVQAKR